MAATAGSVKAIAPELAGVSDSKFSAFITHASMFVDEGVWRAKYDTGHTYMTAHLMTLSLGERDGVGGPITSEAVGGVSASYGQSGPSEEELDSTSYGQVFVALRRTIATGPLVRGGC